MRSSPCIFRWDPQLGNFLAYVVAVATGYVMHSKWSFKDHGGTRTHATKVAVRDRLANQLCAQQLVGVAVVQPSRARPRGADRADAVRHPGGHLRPQPPMGLPLMERVVYEQMAELDQRHWWYRARRKVWRR